MADSCPSDIEAVRIRPLTQADAARGLELSSEAGWNQKAADWDLLVQVCAGWGAERADGRLIGTTMAWRPTASQAWINMVLVAARSRGRGVARRLMDACLSEPEPKGGATLLDATDMGAHLYLKLGFTGDREIIRLLRPADVSVLGTAEAAACLRPVRPEDMGAIIRLDAEVSGVHRPEVLKNFQTRLPEGAWLLAGAAGRVDGFVLGRDGRFGAQLGPVVARSVDEARALLTRALAHVHGPVLIDAPGDATGWLHHLHTLGFAAQRRFVRMGLHGSTWPTDWSRYHAISGPDFA